MRRSKYSKHGMSYTREYRVWQQMVARCTCPTNRMFSNYGGRGIQVCKRWMKFENFYADMGTCSLGLTLERKHNGRGYSPSNCYWATRAAQSRNYRRNRWITYKGETLCLGDWNTRFGLKENVLASRLRRHSVRKVFSELSCSPA
jgi:hypothetical protein